MAGANPLHPIPHPPRIPGLGNALSVDTARPTQHLMELSRTLGPIFWLDVMGKPIIIAANHALINELSDESRFEKSVKGALRHLRDGAGDGLFTAFTSEPNWEKAHNILLPAFAAKSMVSYHPFMLDVARQLVAKWARLNDDDEVDVARDMTSVTLDTIGLAGFSYRFNSFYRETDHPFVAAMVRTLEGTMKTRGLPLESYIQAGREKQRKDDIAYLHGTVDRIIAERRGEMAKPEGCPRQDLMQFMLTRPDRATGTTLSEENIRYQAITFLIAGHETTSGLLSFALYFLMKHPDAMVRARAEADAVFGKDPRGWPDFGAVKKLVYIPQVLKEALRLWPTAAIFSVRPLTPTTVGGAYPIPAGAHVVCLLPALHRDTSVWGAAADVFDPDRFTPEREAALPDNAYKPFGNGKRQCIGRQFALHEAALVLGLILQRFDLVDHAEYQLSIKETLTLKPDGFTIKVRARAGFGAETLAV